MHRSLNCTLIMKTDNLGEDNLAKSSYLGEIRLVEPSNSGDVKSCYLGGKPFWKVSLPHFSIFLMKLSEYVCNSYSHLTTYGISNSTFGMPKCAQSGKEDAFGHILATPKVELLIPYVVKWE